MVVTMRVGPKCEALRRPWSFFNLLSPLATWTEVGRTLSEGYALNRYATARAGFIFLAISGKWLPEESGFTVDVDIKIIK